MSESKKSEKVVAIRKGDASENVVASRTVNKKTSYSQLVLTVRKTCVWVVIITSIIFAFIAILSIWTDADDIVARSWATFIVICAAAGLVALISPLLDQDK